MDEATQTSNAPILRHHPPSREDDHVVDQQLKRPAREEITHGDAQLSKLLDSVHQEATDTWKQQCRDNPPASKREEELLFLQEKRRCLAAVLEERRAKKSKREEKSEFAGILSPAALCRRPYLCGWGGLATLESAKRQEEILQQAQYRQQQALRQKHTLQAASRLAGISLYWIDQSSISDDENPILALHFDVLVHGSFQASYHCFWDVVHVEEYSESDDDEEDVDNAMQGSSRKPPSDDSLHLRLVQHTLPAAIPLRKILHETITGGGNSISRSSGGLLPLADRGFDALKQGLGPLARRLYQACYCYMIRKLAYQEVRKRQKEALSCTIRDIEVNEAVDRLSFDLSVSASTATIVRVEIVFGDKERPQPTSVRVQRVLAHQPHRRGRRRHGRSGEVSDNDSDDDVEDGGMQDEVTDKATTAFRQLPMSRALDQVVLDIQREEEEDMTVARGSNGGRVSTLF